MAGPDCGYVLLVLIILATVALLGVGTGTSSWIGFSYDTTGSTFETSLWYYILCMEKGNNCSTMPHAELDSYLLNNAQPVFKDQVKLSVSILTEQGVSWLEWGILAVVAWTFCFVALVTSCCGCFVKSRARYICTIIVTLVFLLLGGAVACIPAARTVSVYMKTRKTIKNSVGMELLDAWSMWVFLAGAALAILCGVILFIALCQKLMHKKRRHSDHKVHVNGDANKPQGPLEKRRKKKRRVFLIAPKPVPQPIIHTIVVKENGHVPPALGMANIKELTDTEFSRKNSKRHDKEIEPPVYAEVNKRRSVKKEKYASKEFLRSTDSRDSSRRSSPKSLDVVDHFVTPDTDDLYFNNGRIQSQFGHSRSEYLNFHQDYKTPKYGTLLEINNDRYLGKTSSREERRRHGSEFRNSVPIEFQREGQRHGSEFRNSVPIELQREQSNPRGSPRRTASAKVRDYGIDQRKMKSANSDPNLLERKPKRKSQRNQTEAKQLERVERVVPGEHVNLARSEDVMSDENAFIKSKEERDVEEIFFTNSMLNVHTT